MYYQAMSIHSVRPRRVLAAILLAWVSCTGAFAEGTPPSIPAGARIKFHVLAPIASNTSKTGQTFQFALLTPIVFEGAAIPTEGTTGSGTIYLAGHAGSAGHEGDLTLRLDTLRTANGRTVTFADQRFKMNGRNRKVAAGLLGIVPYAGIGAYFIRGSDVRVDPATPIETVLERPATVTVDASVSDSPCDPARAECRALRLPL